MQPNPTRLQLEKNSCCTAALLNKFRWWCLFLVTLTGLQQEHAQLLHSLNKLLVVVCLSFFGGGGSVLVVVIVDTVASFGLVVVSYFFEKQLYI